MPARILPFRRPVAPVVPEEPVRVTVFVNDCVVAHETLPVGEGLGIAVAHHGGLSPAVAADWTVTIEQGPLVAARPREEDR